MILTTQKWDDWEDYAAGMYTPRPLRPYMTHDSWALLTAAGDFEKAAREMIRVWPNAARHNLSLPSGHRAWIGQATCCHHHGATGRETAAAWALMANSLQRRANQVASAIADDYLAGRWPGGETLFDL